MPSEGRWATASIHRLFVSSKEELLSKKYALLTGIGLLAALAFVRSGSTSEASDDGLRKYRVTIENETHAQPFSPGVAVTHRRAEHLFPAGEIAAPGIDTIHDDGH